MAQMAALQTSQVTGGGESSNPLEIVLKHLDDVPHMIYGTLMIVLITFHGQVGSTMSAYADSALGRVLGIGIVLGIVQTLGWTYGLLTALAFLLIVHGSPRLAATGIDAFEDLKRHEAKGNRWFVERVLGENPAGVTSDDVNTEAVQDDSETAMRSGHSNR
jgi:hypothetical protein